MDGFQYDGAQVYCVGGNKCATDAKASIRRFGHTLAPLVGRGEQADNIIDFVEAGVGYCEPSTIKRHGLSSASSIAFKHPLAAEARLDPGKRESSDFVPSLSGY
jgi:hypothetical protein